MSIQLSANFDKVRALPGRAAVLYLSATLLLFLVWPISWQIFTWEAWASLVGYLILCFAVIYVFFALGSRGTLMAAPSDAPPVRTIILGAVLSVLLLAPSTYLYAGRWPWEVLDALADQGDAYRRFQAQLVETEGQRGLIAFARAIASPFIFAVLPLGVLHWKKLTVTLRALVVASTTSTLIFSLMRATDKEFADVFIIGLGAAAVLWARNLTLSGGRIRPRMLIGVVTLATFLLLSVNLYSDRKSSRLGAIAEGAIVCANDSQICVDLNDPVLSWVPSAARFTSSIFVLSTTQGYYGLALSMEKDFRSTFGAGHSPASINIYELITGDRNLATSTYTYRNGMEGWSHLNYWSSLISWIANDVGFVGAVFFLMGLAFVWGKVWRDAVLGNYDSAAVIFCAISVMILYLPANNQFFASYDGYFIFAYWIVQWRFGKATVRSAVHAPVAAMPGSRLALRG